MLSPQCEKRKIIVWLEQALRDTDINQPSIKRLSYFIICCGIMPVVILLLMVLLFVLCLRNSDIEVIRIISGLLAAISLYNLGAVTTGYVGGHFAERIGRSKQKEEVD